ncbi:mitogen-activated protein kinase [Histoplasma capsulatum var. duboisii H88]|uniref:Mitogen-activated protein kinase n=1 Tax=Ajellomyces capsulatus (strain H88) TaxID=544711 RepID=A0A8A1LPX7_AJEC8|nr:mitogen-activated protein kinase [Histoplasma capsulatum var. duboisii H88]
MQESQNQPFDFASMALLSKDRTRPRTPINDPIYFHVKRIGKGAFGAVNKVINVSTGDIYASKRIQIDDLADMGHNGVEVVLEHDASEEVNFAKEIQNIKSTAHEHIVQFVDSTTHPLQLIMEYLPLGNLYYQHERDPLNTEETQLLLAQGLDALRYLHSENITHRDIKPENIVVRGRKELFHIKLADFGLSKIGNSMRSKLGTQFYDAPEVYGRMRNGGRYDNKVDVWSFGVVVLEVSS